MADTTSFMKEFKDQVSKLEGIDKIEFFRSIIDPNRYRPGQSDVCDSSVGLECMG